MDAHRLTNVQEGLQDKVKTVPLRPILYEDVQSFGNQEEKHDIIDKHCPDTVLNKSGMRIQISLA